MDKVNNRGAKVTNRHLDEEMLDEDDAIAIAKAIQASLDETKAEKSKVHLEALQKAMGVATKPAETSAAVNGDISVEDDELMESDEPDEGENDVVMGEGELDIVDNCLRGRGNDGDEV
jgi:hypothetical protein